MSRLRALPVVLAVAIFSCKTAETPPPAPVKAAPVPVKAEPPPPPPEPKIELPAAPALPHAPLGVGEVVSPTDNPTTAEKVELGWKLFFDKRLSKDGSMACAQCHHIELAYTSGAALDAKVGGASNKRNAPSMLNLGAHSSFYWDGRMPTLEAVSNAAWKGQLGADPATVAKSLNEVPVYKALFVRAFNEPASADNVPRALAAWLRSLQSGNSAWDKAQAGDAKALSKEAQEGYKLFALKGCTTCHAPPLFSDFDFHSAGIGDDAGRKDATKADADVGKFKTPSLRNVALTAPYFHDGHAKTLEEAIALMAKGTGGGPNAVDAKLKPQKLSPKEAKALKAFLESLTGESTFTTEPTLP
jgi:cytochrome c peroxidase